MDGINQTFFIPQQHCDCWDTLQNGKDFLESKRIANKGTISQMEMTFSL